MKMSTKTCYGNNNKAQAAGPKAFNLGRSLLIMIYFVNIRIINGRKTQNAKRLRKKKNNNERKTQI